MSELSKAFIAEIKKSLDACNIDYDAVIDCIFIDLPTTHRITVDMNSLTISRYTPTNRNCDSYRTYYEEINIMAPTFTTDTVVEKIKELMRLGNY